MACDIWTLRSGGSGLSWLIGCDPPALEMVLGPSPPQVSGGGGWTPDDEALPGRGRASVRLRGGEGMPASSRKGSGRLALRALPPFEVGTDGLVLPAQLRSVVDGEPGPTIRGGTDALGRVGPALPGELTDANPPVLLRSVSHGASSRGAAPCGARMWIRTQGPGRSFPARGTFAGRWNRSGPGLRAGRSAGLGAGGIPAGQLASGRAGFRPVSWPRGGRGPGRPARGRRPPGR